MKIKSIVKKLVMEFIRLFFNRDQIFLFSRSLINMAAGENNDDMNSNGELLTLDKVLKNSNNDNDRYYFDVGANIGKWTFSLLELAAKNGKLDQTSVYCFEPSLYTFKILNTNFQKMQNVKAINLGMGENLSDQDLFITNEGSGINSLYKRRLEGVGIEYRSTENIRLTTVDNFCKENNIPHITYLKIDVEGSEVAVIRGAENMIREHAIEFIQFEYGGTWIDARILFLDIYDFLSNYGYKIGKIFPSGIEFYDKYYQKLETFQMANFIACLPSRSYYFNKI